MELIFRDELIQKLELLELRGAPIADALAAVRDADAVEHAARACGQWMQSGPTYAEWRTAPFSEYWRCSVCGRRFSDEWQASEWKYCPACGSQMTEAVIPGAEVRNTVSAAFAETGT